jgi:riboflavin kinase / FMN adenylyltransferase
MSIEVTRLEQAKARHRHVAIGTFDGVHVGHREVIRGADTVLTFDPHPLSVIRPEAAHKLIMPFEIKRDVIEGLGVSELGVIPFDGGFSAIEAEEFCEAILIETLGAERVSVGENFRFGRKAKGDAEMLLSHTEFTTDVVPLVEVAGETVSSTRIRAAIAAGDIGTATACLGAPFLLEGEVTEGDRRGRTLGFPTANIVPDDEYVVPGHGVYAAFADGLPAAVNVGVRPTFDTGRGLLVEAYLIDYEGDLYGRTLRVAFIARLRGERRFAGAEELISQMHRDVEDARRLCAEFTPPSVPGAARPRDEAR